MKKWTKEEVLRKARTGWFYLRLGIGLPFFAVAAVSAVFWYLITWHEED